MGSGEAGPGPRGILAVMVGILLLTILLVSRTGDEGPVSHSADVPPTTAVEGVPINTWPDGTFPRLAEPRTRVAPPPLDDPVEERPDPARPEFDSL